MYFLLKMRILRCYVSLPEGRYLVTTRKLINVKKSGTNSSRRCWNNGRQDLLICNTSEFGLGAAELSNLCADCQHRLLFGGH